ncbi:hypothetical protein D3C75_1096870 [compost metagenome]
MLLHVDKIYTNEDDRLFIADSQGETLELQDIMEASTVELLRYLSEDNLSDVVMLVVFEHQSQSGRLCVQPLSIVNRNEIIRLLY